MKFYVLPALATSLLAFNAAQAAEFSEELTFDYMSTEVESYSNDLLAAQLTHYLAPVNTDGGPLAEAAFLAKASAVYVGIGNSSSDFGGGVESSGTPIGAGVTFVTPNQPLVLNAEFMRLKEELDSPYSGDFTTKSLTLGAGYYVTDRTLVALNYNKIDITGDLEGDVKSYTLSAKHLADLGDGRALNIESALIRQSESDDDANAVAVAADFYPQPEFSVGAGVSTAIGDAEGTSLNLNARAFIRDDLSLAFTWTNNRIDDSDIDSTEFGISATARF